MAIYDDQLLREQLVKVENELDHHLKQVILVLRKSFPPDTKNLNFIIRVTGSMRGELELTYGFAGGSYHYNPDITGDTVHMALLEFLRRKGYAEVNSSQIIPALLTGPDDSSEEL